MIISLADPDGFWASYEATLARIRAERPSTIDAVAVILNDVQQPQACIAKFGSFGDDRLSDALADAGWQLRFIQQHRNLWEARHPGTGEELHYVIADMHAGPWADPNSARYARDYDNGWRTAKRNNARLSIGDPDAGPGRRNASRAWRDGFYDRAAGHPKWTWRQARRAGWDNVANYEFARFCGQEWAPVPGGLPALGAGQQARDALSAFQALPSEANLHALSDAVGTMRASYPNWHDPEPDDALVVEDGEVWEDAPSWSPPPAPGTSTPQAEVAGARNRPDAVSHSAPAAIQVQRPTEMVPGQGGLGARVAALGIVNGPLPGPAPAAPAGPGTEAARTRRRPSQQVPHRGRRQ